MLIQVVGLREYQDKKTGKMRKADRFFSEGWRFNTIQEVLGPEARALIEKIPEKERFNLYYTAAHCYEDAKRKMAEMRIIPFDIDGINYNPETYKLDSMSIAGAVATVLKVPVSSLGVVFSGNGVQVLVNIEPVITDVAYFDRYRKHYGVLCDLIELKLKEMGLQGELDPTVFDDARILRLPWTENRKKDKATRMAEVIQSTIEPVPWDIVALSGIGDQEYEVISDEVLKNYPVPDGAAVVQECGFIQHCKNSPAAIKEYEWYAMVSITSRLPDGDALTHKLSEGHPQYSTFETDAKIKQALAASGPRTCSNIATMFDGCKQCPHWGKVKSPIQIKGEDYIVSKDFGYRERGQDAKGNVKSGKPAYDDLIKAFSQEYNYRIIADSNQVYVYNGTHWQEYETAYLRQWLGRKIEPSPSKVEIEEAIYRIKAKNVVARNDFYHTSKGKLNFKNGVFDIEEGRLYPHAPEFGFFNMIPYNYDANATSPMWDKFLLQAMLGRVDLVEALMQYAGYCLMYDSCWAQKCLVLIGTGSNGKTVFMETIQQVLGKDNVTSVQLADILKEKTARHLMVDKLMNYSDETAKHVFRDSSLFKTMVQGGDIAVKKLYSHEVLVENRTKLIISCNEMPDTSDGTPAFFRRFMIIPFDFTIRPEDEGYIPDLKERMWKEELPGICNGIIRAFKKLKETGRFVEPEVSRAMVKEYQRASDTLQLFLDDCVQRTNNEEDVIENQVLFEKYKLYCDESGYKDMSKHKFFKSLGFKLGDSEVTSRNGQSLRIRRGYKVHGAYSGAE